MRRGVIGLVLAGVLVAGVAWYLAAMFWMPGRSADTDLPALTPHEQTLSENLRRDVDALASGIGERNARRYEPLMAAADYIDEALVASGYTVQRQRYQILDRPYDNIEVERAGRSRPDDIVVVGAHYDSVPGSPGANDNASGVAALLALASSFARHELSRTIRFVAFANEEPPFAHSDTMGSTVYAKRSRERGERIVAMLSLETMGYFSDEPNSQRYPSVLRWIYPDTAHFIAFVGNLSSRSLLKRSIRTFRANASIPSEGGALPEGLPGVGWSDHWSFWQVGYAAIMITDTALFRYPDYHLPSDTAEKVDTAHLARVVAGLEHVVAGLAR